MTDIDRINKVMKSMENDENLRLVIKLLSKYCFDIGKQYGQVIGFEDAHRIFKKRDK